MNITICSIFRNSTAYLDRYFDQVKALADSRHRDHFTLLLAEGDSKDDTYSQLVYRLTELQQRYSSQLLSSPHKGPDYGPVDLEARWRQSSYVWSKVWERLTPTDDIVIYIESDLIWEAKSLNWMIDELHPDDYGEANYLIDALAPMVWHKRVGGDFYDTWGYRRRGVCFSPAPPYHEDLLPHRDGYGVVRAYCGLDSAGSCIVMAGVAARAAKFDPPELAVVGLCRSMRKAGYGLYLDRDAYVIHP